MGDTPDALTPAEREQYERYVEGKVRSGEIPRTPLGWRDATAFWGALHRQGKTLEAGLDVVFGLTASGWQREVKRQVDKLTGQVIRVDFHLDRSRSSTLMHESAEAKSGSLSKDRDLQQLLGYRKLLRRGETVRLFTRAEKDKTMSKQARTLLAHMRAQYPRTFIHRPMSERAYRRVMEAGARVLERENQQKLAANLGRLPQLDPQGLSITEIARSYAHVAPHVGIEQVRFMVFALREMAEAQSTAEHDVAVEARKGLGLRFKAAKELELEQQKQLAARDAERHRAIDVIGYELARRDRKLIDREAQQVAQELQQQLSAGRIDLERARDHFHGLAYALGKTQDFERSTQRAAAARDGVPAERTAEQLRDAEFSRQERDRALARQIGAIGAVVEHETERREKVERARLALEVNRERLIAQGMDSEKARLQALVMPSPILYDSDRGRDPREIAREVDQRERVAVTERRQTMDTRVDALVKQGVPREAAQAAVLVQLTSPATNQPPHREREVARVEAQLIERGIPPEIARATAEARSYEVPEVTRARSDEAWGRERGISRDR